MNKWIKKNKTNTHAKLCEGNMLYVECTIYFRKFNVAIFTTNVSSWDFNNGWDLCQRRQVLFLNYTWNESLTYLLFVWS